MKTFRPIPTLAVTAALMAGLGLSACGDDESSDTNGDSTAPGIEVPDGTATDSTEPSTGKTKGEQKPFGEEKGEPKIKGPTETVPGVGVIPKPTQEQRQQVAACVEKAKGDPQKLAKCGQIVVN